MARYILFFSDKCPDTAGFVAELKAQNIEYEEVNITDSMPNLKRFLNLRDRREEFEERKNLGLIGIPLLVLPDNSLIFDLKNLKNH